MLYTSKVFKLYLAPSSTDVSYTRTATGEKVTLPLDDDITTAESKNETFYSVLPITSLLSIRQYFRLLRTLSTVAVVVSWTGLALVSYHTFVHFLQSGLTWLDYIPPAILATVALLYTPQVLRPVAHDSMGHWVNLRTGANNLNSGATIK